MLFRRPICIAVIGLGKIALDQHLPALAASKSFKVVAGCSLNTPSVAFPVYADVADMLRRHPDIEAVSVCTPPLARFAVAARVLAARKHVFLEKPPAATLGQAEALKDLARAKGVSLLASWHSRHAAGVEKAKAWLATRAVRSVVIHWKENVRQWHPGQAWIFEAGGMGVFDPGINALSILTHLLSGRVTVAAADLHVPGNRAMPIRAELDMTAGATTIRAEFDFLQADLQTWEMTIETTDGATLKLLWGGAELHIDGKPVLKGADVEYAGLYRQFAGLIRRRQSDADLEPLRIVADAMLIGHRIAAPDYIE